MLITCLVLYISKSDKLDEKVDLVKLYAFAPNTLKTRRSQWKRYQDFCDRLLIPALPITPQTACRFLVYIGETVTNSTLNNYVSALNSLGKFYDGTFDLRQDFGVTLLLRGFRRLKGDSSTPKDPLLLEDLRKIFYYVDLTDITQFTVWLIILLAFRTLLRKSHFVSSSLDDQDHLLRLRDICFETWGCKVTITSSKTIQFGQRSFEIPVRWSTPPLCAASLLRDYLNKFPKPDSEFIFTLKKSGLNRPVSYNLALDWLKLWCKKAGIVKDVGFHSLRRGAATHMHSLHIDLLSIQRAGDWSSLCVLKYLTVDFAKKLDVERIVSSSL